MSLPKPKGCCIIEVCHSNIMSNQTKWATISDVGEPTAKEINEQVRLAVCRLVRDALEFNDAQNNADVKADAEKDILEESELILDYLKLRRMKDV